MKESQPQTDILGENIPRPDPSRLTTQQVQREIGGLRELLEAKIDTLSSGTELERSLIGQVTIKEYLMDTINERDRKYEQRFASIDKSLSEAGVAVKDALAAALASTKEALGQATTNTKDALVSANNSISTALSSIDKRFESLRDSIQVYQEESPHRMDEKISALREVAARDLRALSDTSAEKFASIQTQFAERDVRADQNNKDAKVAVDAALQAAKEAFAEQNKSSALAIAKSEGATTKQIDQMGVLIQQMNKAFDDKVGDIKERIDRIEGGHTGAKETRMAIIGVIMLLLALAGFFGLRSSLQPEVRYVPASSTQSAPVAPE